jgi:hypothetical protein
VGDKGVISVERIQRAIVRLRGTNVILDQDLAPLYGVPTYAVVRAVKRNPRRFPDDFMLRLSADEVSNLRRQFGASSSWGGRRYRPYAFTEQGVAMLSSVLRSARAVEVNIAIMRAFVQLRRLLASHEDLSRRLDDLEQR